MRVGLITFGLIAVGLVALPASADVFVDVGINGTRIESANANASGPSETTEFGAHFGIGASRSVGERGELSVRLELDNLGSDLLLSVRALDYRRYLTERLAVNVFAGASRLDLATPAYGYYLGAGIQLRSVFGDWDLSIDLRGADDVARDNLLPSDPQDGSPDRFYDIVGVGLYLTRRF